ncbi:Transposase and inactivated derivatives%2C TnpA family [Legionella pneumophila]|uniref:Tn3 family transposase n=1 Tax=Legionella pneumophila TaxID=446 RepID=UPI000770906A|nr:Tn3 family transposase [Legionella pneumophila]CZP45321.1 Transposase and inactivated derivatives%2C TnpA family [Legionella pneumophila]CZP68269.1 Transposase and inactivated derivatives%2C TnpA family [Legionella pneumophila]CZP80511.1 Transposase and inactivated derivatives%2C TnpA family [Legionella pneumophila]
MRLMDVLPDNEVKRFNRPPAFNSDDRKNHFKVDEPIREVIEQAKQPESKIGLLLQYGYFKASGTFFTNKSFKLADIKFVSKILGLATPTDFLEHYIDRTRQNHRLLILDVCGHIEFTNTIGFFDEAVEDMVEKQMHPRKMFYVLVEQLRQKKIELPSYDRIARTITEKFHGFEKNIIQTMAEIITTVQEEALDQLIEKPQNHYERSLLTRLKVVTQSLKPAKIKSGIRNFLIIKNLHKEVTPLIAKLALSSEATKYYAQWVIKAKTTQVAEMTEPYKRHLYLMAFVDHSYKIWQDTLVDVLLKSVQQQLNKAERAVIKMLMEKIPEKNQLTVSVLSGLDDSKSTVNAVQVVVYNEELSNDDKILKLYKIVPSPKSDTPLSQAELDAKKLKSQLDAEKTRGDEFDALSNLSRKLQNRVAEIVKYLEFEACKGAEDLYSALLHYQSVKNITSTAPDAFLDDLEYAAIHRDEHFNVSLYKAILFCKIAAAIKCGQISLVHSYRYLSIDAYLISEHYWEEHKAHLLEKLGLAQFIDIEQVLPLLRSTLDKQFIDVNQRIVQGVNKYITIQKDGSFSVHTPAVDKPDYNSISTIMGTDRYVPILQMMSEMNALTTFTSNFKHHKIKGAAGAPSNEIFYAGLFGLASNIGLHKLANTAVGINYNTLSNTVNWYFSLESLHAVNQSLTDLMGKLWLPEKFKREQELLHTSSDGKKQCVSAESLNANESFKYFGNGKGSSVYRFIDERGILFYSTVFSSSERDAAYVIDGLLHNDAIASNMHSTDTHGYTEMVFAVSHLIGVTFAPRIKDPSAQNLVSFSKMKSELTNKGYPIIPAYYVNEHRIKRNWDTILRLIATIKLREHRASTILKRMGEYSNQHPLQEALKEFGRVIKSIFMLKYFDDVDLRQTIEKQLNKGELANKFSGAISFADQNLLEAHSEDQEISVMCRTIIQNIIILWNYIELTKIIMRSDPDERVLLLENILSASILTWQHVNLHGTYDFSNLLSANDPDYSFDDVVNFKTA